ncbi:MAG TPA: hypothetical protein VIK40_07485 [Geomonas sp.]
MTVLGCAAFGLANICFAVFSFAVVGFSVLGFSVSGFAAFSFAIFSLSALGIAVFSFAVFSFSVLGMIVVSGFAVLCLRLVVESGFEPGLTAAATADSSYFGLTGTGSAIFKVPTTTFTGAGLCPGASAMPLAASASAGMMSSNRCVSCSLSGFVSIT